jgi:hypothetical protein
MRAINSFMLNGLPHSHRRRAQVPAILFIGAARQNHHRYFDAAFSQVPQELETISVGQTEIEHNEVGLFVARRSTACLAFSASTIV